MIFPKNENSSREFTEWCDNNNGTRKWLDPATKNYPMCSFEWGPGNSFVALDPGNEWVRVEHSDESFEYQGIKNPEILTTDGRNLFSIDGDDKERFGPVSGSNRDT